MSVTSLKEYRFLPRDRQANFNGKQLVYVSWDHHLLFAAPFLLCIPPEMTFRQLIEEAIMPLVQPDPDAANVHWNKVDWLKSNQPWLPDFDASLQENGICHKEQIRIRTPGLNSLAPVDQVAS